MKIDGIEFTQFKNNFGIDKEDSTLDKSVESIDKTIKQIIDKMDEPQKVFEEKIIDFLNGKESLPNVLVIGEKARINLTYAVKIREKIIDAYKEIMHMQM